MSPLVMLVFVAVALWVLAVVLAQAQARLAMIEVMLSEGLPPGHGHAAASDSTTVRSATEVATLLGSGVHVFVSRGCHACQRLASELVHASPDRAGRRLTVRYVDRPHAATRTLLTEAGYTVTEGQRDIADEVGADPLPFTVAVGEHAMVARSVSPTMAEVEQVARQAAVVAP